MEFLSPGFIYFAFEVDSGHSVIEQKA